MIKCSCCGIALRFPARLNGEVEGWEDGEGGYRCTQCEGESLRRDVDAMIALSKKEQGMLN